MGEIQKMFLTGLENKAKALEVAYQENVIDLGNFEGRPMKLVRTIETIDGVESVPQLEDAARDFVAAINFAEKLGLKLDTGCYKKRMAQQGIALDYYPYRRVA